jgi:hypothetical protein
MFEQKLPPSVVNKATLRGSEYAWPLTDVVDVIVAAKACGLANLGGQAQFRIPDATCELYWLSLDSGERLPGEAWDDYVIRSADEVLSQFAALLARTDFTKEAHDWEMLKALLAQGVDLNQYLCFVLYFASEGF